MVVLSPRDGTCNSPGASKASELATFADKIYKRAIMKVFTTALFVVFLLLGLPACQHEQTSGKEKRGVEAVPLDQSFSNADIIRNPVSAQATGDPDKVAAITFEQARFHFGEVFEGDIVDHTFTFTNTGAVPLLISDARSTCGCTVPQWPERPIAPGESGSIHVRFDTQNKTASQSKPITITANTVPAQTRIYLDGVVLPKGKPEN